MSDLSQKSTIDFRRGGDRVHDLTEKYIAEIPWIFDCLNAIRGNKESPSTTSVAPAGGQIKVDGGNIYVRKEDNSEWVLLGAAATNFGFRSSTSDQFLTSADIAQSPSDAGKVVTLNSNGVIPFSTTGSAAQIAGKNVVLDNLTDGQVLAYRSALNVWRNENKIGIGTAAALTLRDNGDLLTVYDGADAREVNLPIHAVKRQKAYAVGAVAYSTALPSYLYLECVTAGTTGATAPSALA